MDINTKINVYRYRTAPKKSLGFSSVLYVEIPESFGLKESGDYRRALIANPNNGILSLTDKLYRYSKQAIPGGPKSPILTRVLNKGKKFFAATFEGKDYDEAINHEMSGKPLSDLLSEGEELPISSLDEIIS